MNGNIATDFFTKLKLLFTSPNEFFEMLKKEKGILKALITLVIISLIVTGISFALNILLGGIVPFFSGYFSYSLNMVIWMVLGGSVSILVISFIYSFFIFIFLKLFKVQGKYSEVYKACAYGVIPYKIISAFIPFIGSISVIYSYYLIIVGVATLNYVPKRKVIIPCLLPILLTIILLGLLFFVFLRNFSM